MFKLISIPSRRLILDLSYFYNLRTRLNYWTLES